MATCDANCNSKQCEVPCATPLVGTEPFKGETVELIAEEIGFGAVLIFDPDKYDLVEITEISDMISRVVSAWSKRRDFVYSNLETFGIKVS